MKNKLQKYLKKWLGITKLEGLVGEYEKPKQKDNGYWFVPSFFFQWEEDTLIKKHTKLREDFEELDKKFDALERFLQIEYYKEDKETQVYDWADKNHSEGFRKTAKTYEQMKKTKEEKKDTDD